MTRLLLTVLFFLSSVPAYADWVSVSSSERLGGYTAYLDTDTIRRKGQRVKMWVLYDFKTIQTVAGNSHLSFKIQHEYDCTEERSRSLASKFFSGSMGMGNVVRTDSYESKWEPVTPESIDQDLLKVACGKGQSPGRTPASPRTNTSSENLQTLQAQAAQGDAKAQYILAQKYLQGHGVAQDYTEAVKRFRLAAAQGNTDALVNLGLMYARGQGVPQDSGEAVKWFRLAAAQGDAGAQHDLGTMYLQGQGVPQDSGEAIKWFRLSAAQGYVGAQNDLGVMYFKGHGVTQDYTEAFKWFHLAVAQGDADAQSSIGEMYRDGTGVPQDYTEALKWFRLSAAQGDVEAQNNLGVMYAMGQGVSRDYVRAYMWFSLSAAHSIGDEQKLAADNRNDVVRRMTPEQIAKAQRLSQQCQAQQFKGC